MLRERQLEFERERAPWHSVDHGDGRPARPAKQKAGSDHVGSPVEYREGIFVDYRYYDTKKVEPLFPFDHGLSYTTFEYSNLVIAKKEIHDNETVDVQVTVKNTGSRAGKEIVQLYLRDGKRSVIRSVIKFWSSLKENVNKEWDSVA